MQSTTIRSKYRLKNKLTLYFSQYKFVMLFSTIVLVLGAAFGVYTAIKYSGELELSNLSDAGLVDFLKGNKGTMGLFFPYMFTFLFYCSIIIFLNFKPILSVCSYLLLMVRGYLIGFDITVLIVLYGFAGVLNVIIVILPFELIVWLVLITISAIAIKRNLNLKKFGNSTCNKISNVNHIKTYCFFVAIGVLSLLLKCFLLPLIRVTIIVN